jgi:hypothetical protein
MIYDWTSWQFWLIIFIIIIIFLWICSWFRSEKEFIGLKNLYPTNSSNYINNDNNIINNEQVLVDDIETASFMNAVNIPSSRRQIDKIPLNMRAVEEESITPRPSFSYKNNINTENKNIIIKEEEDIILKEEDIVIIPEKRSTKKKLIGEEFTCQALGELLNDPNIQRNIRPNFLKNPKTGRNLEIDCWSEKYQIGAEYNGIHHYEFPSAFCSNIEEFEEQIYRDEIKRQLSEDAGILIITVPCTVDNYVFDPKKTTYKYLRRSPQSRYDLIYAYEKEKLESLNIIIN